MKEKRLILLLIFIPSTFSDEKKNTATGCDFFNIVSINQDTNIYSVKVLEIMTR